MIFRGDSPIPESITLDGTIYKRFLNCFFLSDPLHSLSDDQIATICRVREEQGASKGLGEANVRVRSHFSRLLKEYRPEVLFEIGPGSFPLFPASTRLFNYYLGDLDNKVVSKNLAKGYQIVHFNATTSLSFKNKSVDMIIGIFVLHFSFPDSQIQEIARIIKDGGVFLANVYHREPNARTQLEKGFRQEGFSVTAIKDPEKICRNHEYWIISKDTTSRLHSYCKDYISSLNLP